MPPFAKELDQLINRHLGTPRWADDFQTVADALYRASIEIDARADRHRWHDETKRDFEQRRSEIAPEPEQLIWRDEMQPR